MARPSRKKGGKEPLIETATEQKAREAAQVASKEPEVSHEGGNPLVEPADTEAQAPDQTEQLEFNEGGDDKSEPEKEEPVQTGGMMDSLRAVWNRLGEIKIEINI